MNRLAIVFILSETQFQFIPTRGVVADSWIISLIQHTESSRFCFFLQYLLVHYPLLAILFLTVSLFGLAMSGFSLFHLYLVLTNQTTNEFYKRVFPPKHRTRLSCQPRGHGSRNKVAKRRTGTDKHEPAQVTQKITETPWQISTPYSKGVWKNIREVLKQTQFVLG